MKIIVDSNIVFSTLLNTKSTLGEIVFHSDDIFDFYSVEYMRIEIKKHWNKLLKISKLTDEQLEKSYNTVLTKISFINEELIPQTIWKESEKLVQGIDVDDVDFIALTKQLKGKLWTGDKALQTGFKSKGFKNVLTTDEILKLWIKKRKQ